MTNPTPAEQAAARRAVAAATIGNGLEFYDFVTFALQMKAHKIDNVLLVIDN